jgi:hypothetical protein
MEIVKMPNMEKQEYDRLFREERNVIWKLTDVRKITGLKNHTATEE